jgi:hypothetical protein
MKRMNSKELLEQARESMRKQNELIDLIVEGEKVAENLDHFDLYLYTNGSYINKLIKPEAIQRMKEVAIGSISEYLSERSVELEKLLGIHKPGLIINQDFEKAVQEMEQSVKKLDPLEEKLKVVLQDEAKKIEAPEKSQDKYPAKKDKRVKTPENMNEADVRRMYVEENRDRKYIANHYGISESKVNNYLFLHDIKRKATKASKPEKQPEETERPLHP